VTSSVNGSSTTRVPLGVPTHVSLVVDTTGTRCGASSSSYTQQQSTLPVLRTCQYMYLRTGISVTVHACVAVS
jgi:hypothetical protein